MAKITKLHQSTITENSKLQDSGYAEYAGSLDDIVSDVRGAFVDQAICPGSIVLAVYPDKILCHQTKLISESGSQTSYDWRTDRSFSYDPVDICWTFPYTYEQETDIVTFGDGVQVTLEVVLTEVADQSTIAIGGEPSPDDYSDSYYADQTAKYALPMSSTVAARQGLVLASKAGIILSDTNREIAEKIARGESLSRGEVMLCSRYFSMNSQSILDHKSDTDKRDSPSVESVKWLTWGGDTAMVMSARFANAILQAAPPSASLTQSDVHEMPLQFAALIQSVTRDEKTKIVEIDGIATIGNIFNSKGEVYPTERWNEASPLIQSEIARMNFTGCVEHPPTAIESLKETCIIFTKWIMQGDEAMFSAKVLPTMPDGHNLQLLLEAGMNIEMSTRCLGSTKKQKFMGQDAWVVQPGMVCKGVDAVRAGASTGSRVTSHRIIQSANPAQEENELNEEQIKALLAEALAANNTAQAALLEAQLSALTQSITALVTPPNPTAPAVDPAITLLQGQLDRQTLTRRVEKEMKTLVQNTAQDNPFVANLIAKHADRIVSEVEAGTIKTYEDYTAEIEKVKSMSQSMFEAVPEGSRGALNQSAVGITEGDHMYMPGTWVKKTQAELAPKTPEAMIEHLIRDIPDTVQGGGNPMQIFQSVDMGDGTKFEFPRGSRTMRGQLRQILHNMYQTRHPGIFDGRAQLNALCLLEQGLRDEATRLLQSVPDGATAVGTGGAPTTTAFIFPLYVYMYPMLFSNEISSVQPMTKPDGRIFFKRVYRVTPGQNWTDEAGNVITDRTPIDLAGGAIDPTYADDPGEFMPSNRVQMRFASKSVTATGKKLSAEVSIEEVMDLQAYFNLDAMTELLGGLAVEIAQEINMEILNDLLGAASGARAVTFGATKPGSWDGTDVGWQQYLGRSIQYVSKEIAKLRNGEMTHVIAGPDAWFALSAGYNINSVPGAGGNGLYAGLQAGLINNPVFTNVKMFQTNLWSQVNRNKILILRKGTEWSDTPHVYAPYGDYTSPPLVIPDTMSQTQGYMHRAAHEVVAATAVGSVTIADEEGTVFTFPTAS